MGEIKVNLAGIETAISQLKQLKADCSGLMMTTQVSEGSGLTNEMLLQMDKQCREMQNALVNLISATEAFFENSKTSMVGADQGAATLMK